MQCTVDSPETGKKYAILIAGDKAMVMHGPNKVKIVFDADIQAGAKVR